MAGVELRHHEEVAIGSRSRRFVLVLIALFGLFAFGRFLIFFIRRRCSGDLTESEHVADAVFEQDANLAFVGEQVEEKINKLMNKNRFAEAAIMDAIASVAVENTVDSYQSSIDLKLKSRAKSTTLRFSPGYCDWDIKEQHKLFDTVNASKIGVALNENSLMSPRKSISGVFGIGSVENVSCKTSNPCMSCGKTDCIARRTEN